jgi:hypothetical protein
VTACDLINKRASSITANRPLTAVKKDDVPVGFFLLARRWLYKATLDIQRDVFGVLIDLAQTSIARFLIEN